MENENAQDDLLMDKFALRLAAADEYQVTLDKRAIAEEIRLAIGIRPIIAVIDRKDIFDPEIELKSKIIIDLRKS